MKIPRQYLDAKVTDNPDFSEAVKAWMTSEAPGLMTLTGPCGTGKTRMLYAIAQQCKGPILWDVPTLVVKVQRGVMMIPDAFNQDQTQIIDRLIDHNRRVLLDDLGAEKTTNFVLQEMYRLISQRELWDKPTLITTNLSIDMLERKLDDRIASRLAGGIVLNFKGKDRRIPNKD